MKPIYQKELIKLNKLLQKIRKRKAFDEKYMYRDLTRRFLTRLQFRQKAHGYKKQNYCDNFYYITTSGELGCIKSKGHDSGYNLGCLLVRRGIIDKKTFEANKEINGKADTFGIKGVIIKHNRVLEDFKKSWPETHIKYLSMIFDMTKPCEMIIDKDFKTAYEPKYREPDVYAGDLCSSSSCMSCRGEGAQGFYGSIPCCNIVRFEQNGEQVGRCIMYEYNGQRHFIRVYGKPEYLPKMYRLIRKEMKPNDLFGRSYCINDLVCDTTISKDTQNMYLDGSYYGLVGYLDGEETKYTMCTSLNQDEVIDEKGEGAEFFRMKSTSDESMGCVARLHTQEDDDDYYICENCGERVYVDDVCWAGDEPYCCDDCAHEAGWYWCDQCGEDYHEDEGIFIPDAGLGFCCEQCANRSGFYKCEECNDWVHEDELNEVHGLYDSVCDSCLQDMCDKGEVVQCDYCNEYFKNDDDLVMKVYCKDNHDEVYVCRDCWENCEYCKGQYDEIKEDKDVEK